MVYSWIDPDRHRLRRHQTLCVRTWAISLVRATSISSKKCLAGLFSINLGAAASAILTPWLLKNYGPHYAFGIGA